MKRIFVLLCILFVFRAETADAEISNRSATAFSLRDIIAQFMVPVVADEARQVARQRELGEILERFGRTYQADPAQSLYSVLQQHPDVRNLRLYVDNEGANLRAMNFEIARMDFDTPDASLSLFILLTRAGAQHVQPESFVGIDRLTITRNGTTSTVLGIDTVGIIAKFYKQTPNTPVQIPK